MYASCNHCNYRSGKHWSEKGVKRELKKLSKSSVAPNWCPICGRTNSIRIREGKKIEK